MSIVDINGVYDQIFVIQHFQLLEISHVLLFQTCYITMPFAIYLMEMPFIRKSMDACS